MQHRAYLRRLAEISINAPVGSSTGRGSRGETPILQRQGHTTTGKTTAPTVKDVYAYPASAIRYGYPVTAHVGTRRWSAVLAALVRGRERHEFQHVRHESVHDSTAPYVDSMGNPAADANGLGWSEFSAYSV